MEANNVTVRKFFLIWQDEAEERWLEEMARKGLHFSSVSASRRYTFQQGQPNEVVYRLDYQEKMQQEMPDYHQLFEDAGWEYIGERSYWRYFRKPRVAGEVNEIFTDNRSKVAKYNRLMLFFLIPMVVVVFPILIIDLIQLNNSFWLPSLLSYLRMGMLVALIFLIGVWLYGFGQLYQRIRALKK